MKIKVQCVRQSFLFQPTFKVSVNGEMKGSVSLQAPLDLELEPGTEITVHRTMMKCKVQATASNIVLSFDRKKASGISAIVTDDVEYVAKILEARDADARFWSFKGRSSRRDWWMAIWMHWYDSILFPILAILAFAGVFGSSLVWFGWLCAAASLLGLLIITCASARRFHDLNMPGWLVFVIPFVLIVPLIGILVFLVGLMALAFFPGTNGDNKYGSDPRAAKMMEKK